MSQKKGHSNEHRVSRRPGLRNSSKSSEKSDVDMGKPYVLNGKTSSRLSSHQQQQQLNAKQESLPGYMMKDDDLVLWKHPIDTINCFIKETFHQIYLSYLWLRSYYKTTLLVIFCIIAIGISYKLSGPHQKYLLIVQKQFLWCGYWLGLGILSSVGLGTGLHTFLLYLGPHIASVTLAASECGTLKFPSPPYPDEIVCPDDNSIFTTVSVLSIMSKVRLEAFMWGAGTALGELPPYFMAKASRLSGQDSDSDSEEEEQPLVNGKKSLTNKLKVENAKTQVFRRARKTIRTLVEKVGFFGILACASIPNPLFDLAGITCGHFLVPFWTFFGATLIGKAIIKMHIQKLFVIVAFNENHVETFVSLIKSIPYIGKYLDDPLREFLNSQKQSLHRRKGAPIMKRQSWLGWIFEWFVWGMIAYFVLSIINSMAQNYVKRIREGIPKKHKKSKD